MTNFRVFYIDKSEGILLTLEGSSVVIPRTGELITVDDDSYNVEYVTHSFLTGSNTHVIEVHLVNNFEFCMRD